MSIKNTEEPTEHKLAYLRVKIKSLADEARIIKAAERKSKKKGDTLTFFGLREHRVGIVRSESRHAQIASRFIRGLPYLEPNARQAPSPTRIAELVNKYGWNGAPTINSDDVAAWIVGPAADVPAAGSGARIESQYRQEQRLYNHVWRAFYDLFKG